MTAIPKTNLTLQQQTAVAERAASVGLSAGAGSGKTHVLTQRFLSHLDPSGPDAKQLAQLDELIAITFTDAAAREMRDRVRTACYNRLETAPPEEEQYWYELLRSLESARISTIHSFCGSLLRRHAVEAGLDPRFAVLEENQAAVLRTQLLDDLLREKLADRDGPTMALAHAWGVAGLRLRMLDMLHHTHDAEFAAWAKTDADELLDAWQACYDSPDYRRAIADKVARSNAADDVLRILNEADVDNETFRERRDTLSDLLPYLPQSEDLVGDMAEIREAAKVAGIGGKSKWGDPTQYKQYGDACTALRKAIDRAMPKPFDRDAARPIAEAALDLHGLTTEAAALYADEKTTLARLDFDDLIAKAMALLNDPDHTSVRQQLAQGMKTILVDEFQDTDAQQSGLIQAVCGEAWRDGRLFFVGDVKQSIYRFRGAQPEVFQALRGELPDRGKLSLTQCFRTQPAVLDFVNALFVGEWGKDYEPLEAVRPQQTPTPAVEFLWTESASGRCQPAGESAPPRKLSTAELRTAEARAIAARLSELIEDQTPLIPDGTPPSLRPLQLGDIAILFRALTDVVYYEQALQEAGLDYYLVGGHAFYAQQEVCDLVNLLRAVASAADEVALAGALRSPFFSLADESLYWLAQRGDSLNVGLMSGRKIPELPEREREKIARAANTLASLRALKDHAPIAEVIDAAIAATGYDATLLAEFLGERKLANLRKLQRHARAADRDDVLGLHGFITQLGEFIARMPKEPPASTSAMDADVIQLMTIHQAKGLEFPLVVLADADRPKLGNRASVGYTPQLGPLVNASEEGPLAFTPDEDGIIRESATGFELHKTIESTQDRAESIRLFYVACTRAADYLIVSGSIKKLDNPVSEPIQLLARRFDLEKGTPRGDLPDDYAEPSVRVIQRSAGVGPDQPKQKPHRANLAKVIEAATAASADAPPLPREIAPIPADRGAQRRFSFSRLSGVLRSLQEEAEGGFAPATPSASEPTVDPLGLGSLVHAILEIIDPSSPPDVPALATRLAPQFFDDLQIDVDHPAVVEAAAMIERFLATPRATSLVAARHIHRESEFQLAWPTPNDEFSDGERPVLAGWYLHGYIDCLYQDANGRWILIDYKTNRVAEDEIEAAAGRYEMQLCVYAMAFEEAFGRPPDEVAVCFLRTGREYIFTWDAAARQAVVEQVNLAIARLVES